MPKYISGIEYIPSLADGSAADTILVRDASAGNSLLGLTIGTGLSVTSGVLSASGGAFGADANTQITPNTAFLLDQATGDEIMLDLSGTVNKAAGTSTVLYADITTTTALTNFVQFLDDGAQKFKIAGSQATIGADTGARVQISTGGTFNYNNSNVQVAYLGQSNSHGYLTIENSSGVVKLQIYGGDSNNVLNAINDTSSWLIPVGTTAQRPAAATGRIRFNTTEDNFEVYTTGGGWTQMGTGSGSGTIGGTISDNQVAVGATTGDTIEGSSALTFVGGKLIIDGTNTIGIDLIGAGVTTAASSTLEFSDTNDARTGIIGTSAGVFYISNELNTSLILETNSVPRMTITGGGIASLNSTHTSGITGADDIITKGYADTNYGGTVNGSGTINYIPRWADANGTLADGDVYNTTGGLYFVNASTGGDVALTANSVNPLLKVWGAFEVNSSLTVNAGVVVTNNVKAANFEISGTINNATTGDTILFKDSVDDTLQQLGIGTGLTISGGNLNADSAPAQVYPGAGIALSTGSAWGTSITNNSANWNSAYSLVTVGSNPGHTHTGSSISSLDAGDTTTGIFSVSRLGPGGSLSATVSSNIIQFNRFGSNQTFDQTINWVAGFYGGFSTMTAASTGFNYDPFIAARSGGDVSSVLVIPRTANRALAWKGYSSSGASRTTWQYSLHSTTSQSFEYTNTSNSPTYVWATNSSGTNFLAARGSMSVNYATSAGNASTATVNDYNASAAGNANWYGLVWASGNTHYDTTDKFTIQNSTGTIKATTFSGNATSATNSTQLGGYDSTAYARKATTNTFTGQVTIQTATQQLVIKGTGSTTANTAYIHFRDTGNVNQAYVGIGSGSNYDLTFYTYLAGNLNFYSNTTFGMRLSTSWNLDVKNNITAYSSVLSDARLKKNVAYLDPAEAHAFILQTKGISYVRKDSEDQSIRFGYLAQDIQALVPGLVTERENPFMDDKIYLSMKYTETIPYITEAIKYQHTRIETAEEKIIKLEKRITELETKYEN